MKINRNGRSRAAKVILGIFILCGVVKDIEFMVLKTDQTMIAENVICKLFCILMVATVLALTEQKWSDIGFKLNGMWKGMKCGFALGIITFAVSYLIEFIVLELNGKNPYLSFYITNFTMSEANVTGISIWTLLICVVGNAINVWGEESLFRGLFIKLGTKALGTKGANMLQALLFGVWHMVSVVLWVMEGSMTISQAVIFGLGYLVLAWILAYEWGICATLTGTVWVGVFEHFFNNFIANSLHVLTDTGADELQIVRIVISNILSLTIVLIVSKVKERSHLVL
ncbi:MAG TPA: CPBP family intramembrane metalloprotease [Lachnospiraceae bacterium]|nr:CPBP family intramembrane metalloprotease [Lachnospiraceae bacterium]